jgi:hypothetical protein
MILVIAGGAVLLALIVLGMALLLTRDRGPQDGED